MPPKKGPKGAANVPKADRVAVDKTFGMKNKKGGAAQKTIKQLAAQHAAGGSPEEKKKRAEKEQREREKAAAEAAARETAELFKPVQVQKVPFGVDPKTVLCQFFKQGHCDKGRRCKFSHDPAVERKGEKRSLYTDTREGEGEGEGGDDDAKRKDDMADWDEAKLREVVTSKHGNPQTTTDKVCKYFIEAVEHGKYGWFWTCPNGGDACKYRHSLPPGFVLKTREQRLAEKAAMEKNPVYALTIEDFLESERHKLVGKLTPVTPETFAVWKRNRMDKKEAEEALKRSKEESGRQLFEAGGFDVDSEDEGGEGGDGDDGDSDEDDDDPFNLVAMRRETERMRAAKEQARLEKEWAGDTGAAGVGDDELPDDVDGGGGDDDNGDDGGTDVTKATTTNGVNGNH